MGYRGGFGELGCFLSWFDRGINAFKVPMLLSCVHGSTAVSNFKAALKPRLFPGEVLGDKS
jgi:hypothetical protein